MSNLIKRVHIYTNGDPSVGINGESALLATESDHLLDLNTLDEEERPVVIERFRAKLQEAFSDIWDETPRILFDFEEAALTAHYEGLEMGCGMYATEEIKKLLNLARGGVKPE